MENIMHYAGIAEKYYNAARPSYSVNGYEKNILIDTVSEKCIFVPAEVLPQDNELLFRCKTASGQTCITLKTPRQPNEKRTNNHPSDRRIFEGQVHPTTWEDKVENFVYQPEELSYEFPKSIKVANLDAFMDACIRLDERNCNPYEILGILDNQSTTDSPFSIPTEHVSIPYYKGHDLAGHYQFCFKHYEKVKGNLYAVFDFTGVKKVLPSNEF